MTIPSIKEIENLEGKKVLLRLDLNLPIKDGKILDDFRLKKALPTINFLIEKKAKVIILSHIGRGGKDSLAPVVSLLNKLVEAELITDYDQDFTKKPGQVFVLENLRKNPGEENNYEEFAKKLASLGDIYVNDAFAVSHREHASIVGLPKLLPSYVGLLFEEEVNELSFALNPPQPFLFILGGAKFETKMPLIEKYLDIANNLFIGGALANNFFKEKGFEVGISAVDDSISLKNIFGNKKIILPKDVIVKNQGEIIIKKPNKVSVGDKILDAGPESLLQLKEIIAQSEFVLWNGPLGYYEDGFDKGSYDLLKIIASSNVKSIIGGGDTVSLVSKMGLEDKISFVSTGGGAMLKFLTEGTLPGIEALKKEEE